MCAAHVRGAEQYVSTPHNPAAAAEVFRHALDRDPGQARTWNNLGSALWNLGSLPEAAAAFGRAATPDPTYAHAFANLGTPFRDRGQTRDRERAPGRRAAEAAGRGGCERDGRWGSEAGGAGKQRR